MKVLIVGAGAVGGYFGAKLSSSGHDVTFVARGAHGAAIVDSGLTIRAPEGELVGRGRVLSSVADARGVGADLVLVAVKTTSLAAVAPTLAGAMSSQGVAIPLQNGVDSEEVLAEAIGRERVVGGVARIAAGLTGPGAMYVKAGGALTLAPLPGGDWDRVAALAARLTADGIACDAKRSLAKVLWGKLLWNAPFNGICALTRRTPGEVLAVEALETLVRDALREVLAVANAEGAELGEHLVDKMVEASRSTFADTEPSMLQDVVAGRPNEVEALQGAVVERGERHGIATPIHAMLLALLRGLQPGNSE